MPWSTPTLRTVRQTVRDLVRGSLPGADANIPNSVLRVLSDVEGALCHLNLQYLDWLAMQLMPDTSEREWLSRFGFIWLVNADGSTGRKMATPSVGTAMFYGQPDGVVVPLATQIGYADQIFETTAEVTVDDNGGPVPIIAIFPGAAGNLPAGTQLNIIGFFQGLVPPAYVISLYGGTDEETDDELRARILQRIRQPPMGGDGDDYVNWTLRVPGVTRAWSYPLEMGMGTVTVRFMCDDLRASGGGFPLQEDVDAVSAYLDTVRPVAVKDFFVVAPKAQRIDFRIVNCNPINNNIKAAIEQSIRAMIFNKSAPGQTIYRVWKSDAVLSTGVTSFDLISATDNVDQYGDNVMPDDGHIATLGDIYYE
jgi:uncharacterized phage protein gp47/JayE